MNQHTCVSLWGKSLNIHMNNSFLATRLLYKVKYVIQKKMNHESFLEVFDMAFFSYKRLI